MVIAIDRSAGLTSYKPVGIGGLVEAPADARIVPRDPRSAARILEENRLGIWRQEERTYIGRVR